MTTPPDTDLPPLPEPYQREVVATYNNTDSVRKGYEMGGYVKTPDLFTADQIQAYAREAIAHYLKLHEGQAVAYRWPKAGVNNGYHYLDSIEGEEPRFNPLWERLFLAPQTQAIEAAVMAEREACAKVAEQTPRALLPGGYFLSERVAAAIRARTTPEKEE
jgi:hypothetical protein